MSYEGKLPRVFEENGVALTNTHDVAAAFGKRHEHVLASVDNLLKNNITENPVLAQWFIEQVVPREDGPGRTLRSFDMNRDGWTLLVMGFTGSKAVRFKLRYIEAFNRMEAALKPGGGQTADVLGEMRRMLEEHSRANDIALLDMIRQAFPVMRVAPSVPPPGYLRFPDWLAARGITLTGRQKSGLSRRLARFCTRNGFRVESGYGGVYRGGNAYPMYAMERWWAEGGSALTMSLVRSGQAARGTAGTPLFGLDGGKRGSPA